MQIVGLCIDFSKLCNNNNIAFSFVGIKFIATYNLLISFIIYVALQMINHHYHQNLQENQKIEQLYMDQKYLIKLKHLRMRAKIDQQVPELQGNGKTKLQTNRRISGGEQLWG